MANEVQRLTDALTAILEQAPTNTQLIELGAAAMAATTDEQIEVTFPGVLRANLSNAQKAYFTNQQMRLLLRKFVRNNKSTTLTRAQRAQRLAAQSDTTF